MGYKAKKTGILRGVVKTIRRDHFTLQSQTGSVFRCFFDTTRGDAFVRILEYSVMYDRMMEVKVARMPNVPADFYCVWIKKCDVRKHARVQERMKEYNEYQTRELKEAGTTARGKSSTNKMTRGAMVNLQTERSSAEAKSKAYRKTRGRRKDYVLNDDGSIEEVSTSWDLTK